MRIPIVSGIVADESGALLTSYPTNREPVLQDTGISEGYLAVPMGIRTVAEPSLGADRGGINWNGVCYRVMGTSLVRVGSDWSVSVLGDVGQGDVCALAYSFDNLIVNSGTRLYYWNSNAGLRRVSDTDLGEVHDAIYVDGYTMTTDGEFLVVTDLNDPTAVDPLKYGSAEESPDAITGLAKLPGEVYAFGRYTIQPFQNVGGTGFPFRTVKSGAIMKGCVGPRAKANFAGSIAFVGGPENQEPGVWVMSSADADKISPLEVDKDLAALSDEDLSSVWVEVRGMADDERLILHLPTHSWGFSWQVTRKSQVKTWCRYEGASGRYEGRGLVYCYGQWIVGSSSGQIGVLDSSTAKHYGQNVGWQFDTTLIYNEARRGQIHELELIGTPGRGEEGRVFLSYTKDGETWSMERAVSAGKPGEHRKRVAWRPGIRFEQYMGLRFRGVGAALMGIARLEARLEPLDG